jgi:hypothetical protein
MKKKSALKDVNVLPARASTNNSSIDIVSGILFSTEDRNLKYNPCPEKLII